MENSSKALYIAGSVLAALIVISFLIYSFNNIGKLQKVQDDIEYEEEISKFNMEYEAFDKRIMYGVDVISCINKAVSNNEKYVGGNIAGDEALVQVCVYLKEGEELKESYQLYYINDNNKEVKLYPNNDELVKEIKNDFKDYNKMSFCEFFNVNEDEVYHMSGGFIETGDSISEWIDNQRFLS